MRLVAGDLGGTKTLLQYVDLTGGTFSVVEERRFETIAFSSFEEILGDFLASHPDATSCCIAVAGPVIDGRANITNVGWDVSEQVLASRFGLGHVRLVNDFFAVARGVPLLKPQDFVVINEGERDRSAPIAIVGAGTGLGEAFVVPEDGWWRVISSEGGHADFGPVGALQRELHAWLEERYGRVSYERVVSGMGLSDLYTFLVARSGGALPDIAAEDLPAYIAVRAATGDETAGAALDLFVDVYGAEAGNAALKVLARGGVFLAGGIAPKHQDRFTSGRFMRSFLAKGRFAAMMKTFPVYLITEERVGLIGAADVAREAAE
jgi:glucokinase